MFALSVISILYGALTHEPEQALVSTSAKQDASGSSWLQPIVLFTTVQHSKRYLVNGIEFEICFDFDYLNTSLKTSALSQVIGNFLTCPGQNSGS